MMTAPGNHNDCSPKRDESPGATAPTARRSRERTTERILDAAEELFARRDPKAVTVREIAEKAGVTHALVHQYVGSKAEIINAVVVREAPSRQRTIAEHPDFREVMPLLVADVMARRVHTRAVVRSAMDGVAYADLQERSETGRMLAELAANSAASGRIRLPAPPAMDSHVVVAAMIALTYGWVAVGEWLIEMCDLPKDDPAAVQRQITEIVSYLGELVLPPAEPDVE